MALPIKYIIKSFQEAIKLSKVDRATDLLSSNDNADCFPMQLFGRECFTEEEMKTMLEAMYKVFKARHSSLRLGPLQYQRACLGCLERMERQSSPEAFDENNYRERNNSPLLYLLFSGFQRLKPIVNSKNK